MNHKIIKHFTLVLMFFCLAFTEQSTIDSITIISKNVNEMKNLCNENTFAGCSNENKDLAVEFLKNQLDQLNVNMENARKMRKIRRNRLREEQMLLQLRQHFLDRHI
jgi:hypothetical protein